MLISVSLRLQLLTSRSLLIRSGAREAGAALQRDTQMFDDIPLEEHPGKNGWWINELESIKQEFIKEYQANLRSRIIF